MPRGTDKVNPKKPLVFRIQPVEGMTADRWLAVREHVSVAVQIAAKEALDQWKPDP
jgi:hypothetical protein